MDFGLWVSHLPVFVGINGIILRMIGRLICPLSSSMGDDSPRSPCCKIFNSSYSRLTSSNCCWIDSRQLDVGFSKLPLNCSDEDPIPYILMLKSVLGAYSIYKRCPPLVFDEVLIKPSSTFLTLLYFQTICCMWFNR